MIWPTIMPLGTTNTRNAAETVQNYSGKAAANTNGGRNNNREQHHANNGETNRNSPETQTSFFQRNNSRNNNQQNRGSGNNRPNHQQNNNGITCHACNQPGHIARNVHSSRAETIAASKIITDSTPLEEPKVAETCNVFKIYSGPPCFPNIQLKYYFSDKADYFQFS